MELLLLILGGAAGTLLRFSIEKGVLKVWPGAPVPWTPFTLNFAGCFTLGILLGSVIVHDLPATYYMLLGGGITTFSIFGLQLVEMTQSRLYGVAGFRAFTGWLVGTGAAAVGVVVSLR
ncbi:CrcB family protein [Streptomyces sp. NPDC051243]|uniref:CrcB family protein n=1 Tax=Streptomyces sp. NPDC051243 TaxID=3365646 RepID=UPI0037942AD0